MIGAIFGPRVLLRSKDQRWSVAIPFVIGAIFGRSYYLVERLRSTSRNPLCDRGYLRTEAKVSPTGGGYEVAIPFVIGAIFGLEKKHIK